MFRKTRIRESSKINEYEFNTSFKEKIRYLCKSFKQNTALLSRIERLYETLD